MPKDDYEIIAEAIRDAGDRAVKHASDDEELEAIGWLANMRLEALARVKAKAEGVPVEPVRL